MRPVSFSILRLHMLRVTFLHPIVHPVHPLRKDAPFGGLPFNIILFIKIIVSFLLNKRRKIVIQLKLCSVKK